MERDFMGLNSRDSEVLVKEEAVEGCKGVQWPFSNKVSALPHFMSFKVAQEEKAARTASDSIASAGFMTISTADAFDTTHKRPMQRVRNGQGGSQFSMTTYSEQHNVLPMHLSPDLKMAAANQPVSVPISYPFLKTHFTGATMKQQLIGGIPIAAPHSLSPLSVAGTTKPWLNSKSSRASPQLTIFYDGTVNVYDDISPEKAQAIMFLAGNGSTTASKIAQPIAQAQLRVCKQTGGGDVVLVNQPTNTSPGSGISSPMSISSHPVGHYGNGNTSNDELMEVKTTGALNSQISKVNPQKVVTSFGTRAATTMIPSAVPQARQASLARFLEKRKERVMSLAPYPSKKSPECSSRSSEGAFSH